MSTEPLTPTPSPSPSPSRETSPIPWRILAIVAVSVLGVAVIVLALWLLVFGKSAGGATDQPNGVTATTPARSGTPTSAPTARASGQPTPTTAPPAAGEQPPADEPAPPACGAGDVTLTLAQPLGDPGPIRVPILFNNAGTITCTLTGYPTIFALGPNGSFVGTAAQQDASGPSADAVRIAPGGPPASVLLTITHASQVCDEIDSTGFIVTLPGTSELLHLTTGAFTTCADPPVPLLKVTPFYRS